MNLIRSRKNAYYLIPSAAILTAWLVVLVGVFSSSSMIKLIAGYDESTKPKMLNINLKKTEFNSGHNSKNSNLITIAGTGSCVPIIRIIALKFMETKGGAKILVHDSIGSTGGVRAVKTNDIKIGLISRPLGRKEKENLLIYPFARVGVVVAVNSSVREEAINEKQLISIYSGSRKYWSDGRPVVVIQRERGDSSHRVFNKFIKGFEEINYTALKEEKFRVVFTDQDMIKALSNTPGAVGITDIGLINIDGSNLIKPLRFNNIRPSAENIKSGKYPYSKLLSLIVKKGEMQTEVGSFLKFVGSKQVRLILEKYGYIPVEATDEK